jgi:ribosomal protein L37AE/L43A
MPKVVTTPTNKRRLAVRTVNHNERYGPRNADEMRYSVDDNKIGIVRRATRRCHRCWCAECGNLSVEIWSSCGCRIRDASVPRVV